MVINLSRSIVCVEPAPLLIYDDEEVSRYYFADVDVRRLPVGGILHEGVARYADLAGAVQVPRFQGVNRRRDPRGIKTRSGTLAELVPATVDPHHEDRRPAQPTCFA